MSRKYPEGSVRSPKLKVSDSYKSAKFPLTLFVLMFLPIFTLLLFVVSWDRFFFSLSMILMFFAPFLFMLGGFLATRPSLTGAIRVGPLAPFRFLPSRLTPLFYVASCLFFAASFMPGLEAILSGESTIAQTPALARQFWFVTAIGGLAGIAHAIVGIFYPFGVTLDQRGIVWRTHLGRPRFVSWESLEQVKLGKKGRAKVLYLDSYDEGRCTIIPMTMGSDPIVIAETIEYFRRHPSDRELLSDPFEALSLVVDFDPALRSTDEREAPR